MARCKKGILADGGFAIGFYRESSSRNPSILVYNGWEVYSLTSMQSPSRIRAGYRADGVFLTIDLYHPWPDGSPGEISGSLPVPSVRALFPGCAAIEFINRQFRSLHRSWQRNCFSLAKGPAVGRDYWLFHRQPRKHLCFLGNHRDRYGRKGRDATRTGDIFRLGRFPCQTLFLLAKDPPAQGVPDKRV
jgi:hypothetical protein